MALLGARWRQPHCRAKPRAGGPYFLTDTDSMWYPTGVGDIDDSTGKHARYVTAQGI